MGDVVAFPVQPSREPEPESEPLWREAAGRELREERQSAGRTLADVAEEAGVSTQYLVELTTRVARTLGGISGPVALAA